MHRKNTIQRFMNYSNVEYIKNASDLQTLFDSSIQDNPLHTKRFLRIIVPCQNFTCPCLTLSHQFINRNSYLMRLFNLTFTLGKPTEIFFFFSLTPLKLSVFRLKSYLATTISPKNTVLK